MVKYKVNSPQDGQGFINTDAYGRLYDLFKDLKIRKGRIIHVIGAPGTGKSANIYQAVNSLNLNVYEATILLDSADKSSLEVFQEFFKTLRDDMKVETNEEVYKKASEFDAVLIADRFHDSHLFYEDKVGFSLWMDHMGFKSFPFYLLLIIRYFWNILKFRRVNLIFQTAWKIRYKGVKHDLFTDFGLLSKFLIGILKIFFEVVEIKYSESEITEIIKKRFPEADDKLIKGYIEIYGSRIRFILDDLEVSEY